MADSNTPIPVALTEMASSSTKNTIELPADASHHKRSLEIDEEAMNEEPAPKRVETDQSGPVAANDASSSSLKVAPVMTQEEEELASMQVDSAPTTSSTAGMTRMQKSKKGRKYLGKDDSRNDQDKENGTYKQQTRMPRDGADENREKKLPKKRVAIMLGFSGQGYSGMQM